jgi:monoamine oxidase
VYIRHGNVHARLDHIAAIDRGKARKDVTILGAGMAGLVAGYELKRLGHNVVIFEASKRVGGRVHTHRFGDGSHGELGAMRIPTHHHYTRHYVKKMGLTLRRFVTSHENLECFYDIRHKITRMRDAPTNLYSLFELSRDQLRMPIPPAMLSEARDQLIRTLTDAEKDELLSSISHSRRVLDLDRTCMGDFLHQRIGPGAADLVGLATGMEAALDRSLTMFLRDLIASEGPGLHEIAEGMDALPTSISESLVDNIVFGTEVLRISRREAGVSIIFKDETEFEKQISAPVICTIPFTVLRALPYGLQLSSEKEKVIRRLGYLSSTKVLLHSTNRFWEKNYGIYGGASQTDTLIRALYYPSDFVHVIEEPRPTAQYSGHGLYTGYLGGRFRSTAPPNAAGVLVGSYTWGADAKRMGALSAASRKTATMAAISRFHPEILNRGVIDDHFSVFWDDTPWMRGGAYSFLEPLQQYEMISEASAPEGNLYFAGEHCSLENAWIQGAITSALDAVEAIVSLP